MIAIPGYQFITKISESSNSLVYRARRTQDNQPVILKALKKDYPTSQDLANYKKEYDITYSLNLEGVNNTYSLEKYHNTLIITFEDFGGEALNNLINDCQLSLKEFLNLAIKITKSLAEIHAANIIHKDINPSNIIYNPVTKQLKIIDFSISTVLSIEHTQSCDPNAVEGTLAYISPEQTGRMNRALDYRTDFYSLGATFYELLTHKLPFETSDVMELIHCHIAKQPIPPHELNPIIPEVVSDIVMKLLAKTVEERYQNAYGIKADLEECLKQLETKGKIIAFPLASQDITSKFQLSQKIYGREQEIKTLLSVFERLEIQSIASEKEAAQNLKSKVEIILIKGCSGIGKSSLVQEIFKPINQRQGYFIQGKFEQYHRNIPYFAVIKAFQELVRQLLTENELQLAQWRSKLLTAFGANGQVIIDVIPELELIVGKQPALPGLGSTAVQNRFKVVFQNFIRVFTQTQHPLVIFLDDLQWADSGSLNLIELLLTAGDHQCLFLIGAYRENEVNLAHPLVLTLNKIQHTGIGINYISLLPLSLNNINQLISDTLHCSFQKAYSLAELVINKTNGNPFFISEFLKSLHDENLIYFNLQKGIWEWDIEQIKLKCITDNVVELLVSKIQKLPTLTQKLLKIAACIGNQFDLFTLASSSETDTQKTEEILESAIALGLLIPLSNLYKLDSLNLSSLQEQLTVEYQFVHDRIQQAAYSLISVEDQQIIHRKIGLFLLKNTPISKRDRKIFDIVNQLNLSIELNHHLSINQLAALNLAAGKKAKASTAFELGLKYLTTGLNLLEAQSWHNNYELTLSLFVEAAEASYLVAEFQQMEVLADVVIKQAKRVLDKVKVYEIKILALVAQSKPLEAVKIALKVMNLLRVSLPEHPNNIQVLLAAIATKVALTGKPIANLINLPEMTDSYNLAVMQIIGIVGSPTYNAAPQLAVLLALKVVNLSLKYGNTSMSAYGYASYGVILCGVLGDINSGYKFGQLALTLVEQFNAKELKPRILMVVNNFIRHWKEHLREGLQPLLEAYKIGLETGDLEFSAYSAYIYCYHCYFLGKELATLESEMTAYIHVIHKFKQETAIHLLRLYRQVILNLKAAESPWILIGESYDEQIMLPLLLQNNHITAIFDLYYNKLILCYLFEQYPEAVKNAAVAEKYLDGARASPSIPIFYFYDALAQLQLYNSASKAEQKYLLKKVAVNYKKIKKWAHYAPMNHLHKFYLLTAEYCRVRKQNFQATDYYDRAIALAKENEYLNEEALAHELAAKFYLGNGKTTIAQAYMQNARYCYLLWGATRKVSDLDIKYAQLLSIKSEIKTPVDLTSPQLFDLTTVIKASQAISSEIIRQHLLDKLMEIIVENAGAEIGFLLLFREEKLIIEAVSSFNNNLEILQQSIPTEISDRLPRSIINYVVRTQENVVLSSGSNNSTFTNDTYIKLHQPKSILCAPLVNQSKLIGIAYLENNLVTGAFTSDRIEILKLLCSQAAISLQNARLYQDLHQSELKEREKAQQLEQSLQELQQAQTQLLQAQEKLLHDAFHDPLTGLPNRAYFIDRLEHAIQFARRDQDYLYAVLFIDLDRFKVINDSLGHLVGDALLINVAIRLKACLRATDTVARLGGDEFVILLEKIKDVHEVILVTERIQATLNLAYQLHDHEVFTGASIGITLSTIGYERAIDVLRDADVAMYNAKELLKGSYKIFAPEIQNQAIARLQLENDLRKAVEAEELSLHYQPIIELSSHRLNGFEALARWHHPVRGWISPVEFIPIAEESGLINSLGWWVLQQACQQLYIWQQQFPQEHLLVMNVNLSAQQLKQVDVIERIEQILQITKISGECLKLEITESGMLETSDLEAKILEQLKGLGIRLCIDDFGTGYSSLSRLHELPIDTLKIDRSFVSRLGISSDNTEIVQTIITLAHTLGIDAVAEGIETPQQLEKLQELGCDLGQGYLFSKPVDSQTATQLL